MIPIIHGQNGAMDSTGPGHGMFLLTTSSLGSIYSLGSCAPTSIYLFYCKTNHVQEQNQIFKAATNVAL